MVRFLEDSGILSKGVNETTNNKAKKEKMRIYWNATWYFRY